jgi:hypothetical protein
MWSFMTWPPTKNSLGSQTKKQGMDGTHAHKKKKKKMRFGGKPRKRANLQDLDVDGRTIIKSTLESWTGFSGGTVMNLWVPQNE